MVDVLACYQSTAAKEQLLHNTAHSVPQFS